MKVRPYATGRQIAVETKVITSGKEDMPFPDVTVTTTVVYLTPEQASELIMELHKQISQSLLQIKAQDAI